MRTAWWLTVCIVVLAHATLAFAQTERHLSVSLQSGPTFSSGRWTPLQLTLRNNVGKDVDGSVETEIQTPAGTYTLSRPVFVPANSRVQVDMLATFQAQEAPRGKNDKALPVATFFWRGSDNADLAREPIFAIADNQTNRNESSGLSAALVAQVVSQTISDDVYEAVDLPAVLQTTTSYPFAINSISASALMRRDVSLDPCRLIIVDQQALTELDAAQQSALLNHVRGGATVLVLAQNADIASTWLGSMLPMDLIGEREIPKLETTQFGTLKTRKVVRQQLAIARPEAKVVASNAESTLAAYTELGFGRVCMVAFPVNSLDPDSGQQVASLWADLIGVQRTAFHDPQTVGEAQAPGGSEGSKAQQTTPQADTSLSGVLPSMVGAQAPPWRTAAIIAGAYSVVILLVLLFSGAKHRPLAMVGCVGVGVILAGGVLGMNSIKAVDTPLTIARLAVVDQSGDAVRRQDILTFYGQDRDNIAFKMEGKDLPRAMLASGRLPPRVVMFPFEVKDVSASTGSYASVWQIRSQQTATGSRYATIAFGPNGASLNADTGLVGTLEAPRLLIGGSVFSVPDIGSGKQTVAIGPRNGQGEWTSSAGVIADEKSKLRTDILQRVESRRDPVLGVIRRTADTKLVGFTADDKSSLELGEPIVSRAETLIRSGVSIQATPPGTTVRLDPGFTAIRREAAASLPYRHEGDVWNEASQGGPWLFAIAPPTELGKVDPKQLTLDIDFRGPGFDIQMQKGQCQSGRVRENLQGEVIVSSKSQSGGSKVTIDLTPSDYDANGWVWIRMTVEMARPGESLLGGLTGDQVPTNWRLLRFDPTLTGIVTGAPQAVLTTWPVNAIDDEKPAPKPQPKKDEKKPEPKKPEPKKADPKKPEAKPAEAKPK